MSEEGSSCSKRSKVGDESFLPVTVDLAAVLQEQEEEEEREDLLSVASFASRSLSSFVTTRPLVSLPAPGELLRRPDKTRLRLFLVRHGQSQANVDTTVLLRKSDHVVALSEEGRKQAESCGNFLAQRFAQHHHDEPIRIVTSPYKRARDTADSILSACRGAQIVSLSENLFLGEQQFGLFEGLSVQQIQEQFPREHQHFDKSIASGGRFYARMPLGESRFDVTGRAVTVINNILQEEYYTGVRNIVVVAHGITLRAFAMAYLERSHEWFESQPNPKNCSVRLIEGTEDRGYIFSGFEEPRQKTDHSDKESELASHSSLSNEEGVVNLTALQERMETLAAEMEELKKLLAIASKQKQ